LRAIAVGKDNVVFARQPGNARCHGTNIFPLIFDGHFLTTA
jgi:hypothetical protein